MNAAMSSSRMGGRAPRRTATRPAATPAAPSTDAAQSRVVTTVTGNGHENHQGGPAAGRGVLTTAAPGPASEIPMKTAIASAMDSAENQPSSRVRRAPDGGAPGRRPAWVAAGWAGDTGGRRDGTRVSRLLSCSFIWHAPVATVGQA